MPPVVQKSFDPIYALKEADLCNSALSRAGAELIKDTDELTKQGKVCRSIYADTRDEVLSMFPFSFATKSTLIPEDAAYTFPMDGFGYAYKAEDWRPFTCTYGIGATLLEAVSVDLDDRFLGRIVSGTNMQAAARIVSYDDTAHTITLDRATTNTAAVTVAVTVNAYIALLKVLKINQDKDAIFDLIGASSNKRIMCDHMTEYDEDGTTQLLEMKYTEQVLNPDLFDKQFKQALELRLASKFALEFTKAGGIVQQLQGEFSAILALAKSNSNEQMNPDEPDPWWTERIGVGVTRRVPNMRG